MKKKFAKQVVTNSVTIPIYDGKGDIMLTLSMTPEEDELHVT
jgi:hypothetical protein